jgi:hypothetical protein
LKLLIATSLLASGCSGNETAYTLECNLTGPDVGKADVRFAIDTVTKKILWSTGVVQPTALNVSEWTGAEIKGRIALVNTYDLSINLAANTAAMSVGQSNNAGDCVKGSLSDAEKAALQKK